MKKIVFLVAVGVLVSVAQTYDIYNVNGKHYEKISGQIDKITIDRYVQAALLIVLYQFEVTKENKEDNKMSAININRNNFQHEVMNSDRKVLLDFWAHWW